jgi:hypothetical protein
MTKFKWFFMIISIGLNALLGFLFLRGDMAPKMDFGIVIGPFSITNTAAAQGGESYVVAYKNGVYWWSIDSNVLSMNIGVDGEVVARLDAATGHIKSTTVGLLNPEGKRCYYTDMNGDGIPDKKRIGGEDGYQIFYNGDFVPSYTDGENRYVKIDGIQHRIKFNGVRWVTEDNFP